MRRARGSPHRSNGIRYALMEFGQIVLLVFALLMVGGGVAGLKSGGSKVSLVAGIVSAVLLLVALLWSWRHPTNGYWMGVGVSGLLGLVFFVRMKKTKKFLPSGLLLILSLIAAGLLIWAAASGYDSTRISL